MPNKKKHTGPHIAPFEVVVHNTPEDCWVSFLGKVWNLTALIKDHAEDDSLKPILAEAGKDISHWFDERTGELQHYVHPITGVLVPYCPHGKLLHVPPQVPSTAFRPANPCPWWKDEKYFVGYLTKRVRPVRIINTLIVKEAYLNVCCEDTIHRIKERYELFNTDGDSYLWTYDGRNLKMDKTLEENGIPDERDGFVDLGLPQNLYIPGILLYYMDDLKHAISDDTDEDNLECETSRYVGDVDECTDDEEEGNVECEEASHVDDE